MGSRYQGKDSPQCANETPLTNIQAEFLYKVKPKLPNQFKAAEVNGVPFTIVIGEDEVAQGKVKIKEMGLREGHPEKEGILVDLVDVAAEVKQRLRRKADLEGLFQEAEGLRVVDGIKGETEKIPATTEAVAVPVAESEKPVETTPAAPEASAAPEATSTPDPKKPADVTPASQEAIGAVPAS